MGGAGGAAPDGCAGVLICPVCGEPLAGDGRTLRCPRGHSFDRAREGYYHLLPAGHGRSKIRGDTREMVRARRRFLERGHYAPLAQAIRERVSRERASTVLEVGCGAGYYIGGVARDAGEWPAPDSGRSFIGVDVSKEAVRLAARTYRDVCFLVNDVKRRLTVADGSVDVLLDIFAPRNPAEFARVVRPGGLLVVVIPRPDHLSELRERLPLLGIEPEKKARALQQFGAAFHLEAEVVVEYRRVLEPADVLDLVGMTPSAWHVDAEALAAVEGWGPVPVTIGVDVLLFRRS